MRHEVYLWVRGDEAVVRLLHRQTNVPEATIKQIKARDKKTGEQLWVWGTEHVALDEADIDAGIKAFLSRYRPFFAAIKEHRGLESDLYLELVTYYQEGEAPPGLYLSAETIKLMSEVGADFDNDAVPDIRRE